MTAGDDKPLDSSVADPWARLRHLTRARVALGHAGASQPTEAHLAFQLAHARARDAVHTSLEESELTGRMDRLGLAHCVVNSRAGDRVTYLTRPDLGRRLSQQSVERLRSSVAGDGAERPDLVIVLADGLSAKAVQDHGLPMLECLLDRVTEEQWQLAPIVVANQGRVALGDEIGECLNAAMVVVLIGERPGLSSPDSLGAYMTYGPRVGLRDDARNCISNIRPEGLSYGAAAFRLWALLKEARVRKLSGVNLKDDSEPLPLQEDKAEIGNFLLGGREKHGS